MYQISGSTKTKIDYASAHAFLVQKNEHGLVELRYKPSAALSKEWLGLLGTPHSPGFVILKNRPTTPPHLFKFEQKQLSNKDMLSLLSKALEEVLSWNQLSESFEWLRVVATTMKIPSLRQLEQEVPKGEVGIAHMIGIAGKGEAEVR